MIVSRSQSFFPGEITHVIIQDTGFVDVGLVVADEENVLVANEENILVAEPQVDPVFKDVTSGVGALAVVG